MSAPRREYVPVAEIDSTPNPAELSALSKYRSLAGESLRVLRCLETILVNDRFEIVDTGQIARFLGIRSQAVSRALKTLVDQSIIARGERIGRSHTFRRLDPDENPSAETRIVRLDAGARETVRLVEDFLRANDTGLDDLAVRKYLKFGQVLYYVHDNALAGVALVDYNPIIDSGPTIVHLIVDQAMRTLGHGRRFLTQIETMFAGQRIFAHAPVAEKELIIALLNHGFDITGQQVADGEMALILKKGPGV